MSPYGTKPPRDAIGEDDRSWPNSDVAARPREATVAYGRQLLPLT